MLKSKSAVVASILTGKRSKHACGCGEVVAVVRHGKQPPKKADMIKCSNRGYVEKSFAAENGHLLSAAQLENCNTACNFACLS